LDCSTTATHTLSVSLRLRAQTAPFNLTPGAAAPASDAVIGFNFHGAPWTFYTRPSAGATFSGPITPPAGVVMLGWSSVDLVLLDQSSPYDPANHHVLTSGATGSLSSPNWLGTATGTLTVTNLRLGVTIETSGGVSVLRYAWFSDAATTESLVLSLGATSITATTLTYADPPALYGPQGLGPYLSFYRDVYPSETGSSAVDHVEFSAFTVNGSTVNPPSDPQLYKASGRAHSVFYVANQIGLPFKWRGDLAAIDSDGTAEAADATYGGTTAACPFTVDRNVPQYFVEDFAPVGGSQPYVQQRATAAVLADPWLSAQTIRPYASEQAFTLEGNAPKDPSAAAFTTWNVGTVDITSPLSVLRSANAWSTDAGTVAIGGTATVPIFTVTVGPATVKRALSSQWRNWNTGADPLNVPGENYTATKRNAYSTGAATPDVWGWGLYSFLDVDLTPGAAGSLTFEATWAVVRENGAIVTVVRSYTATWGAGRSTQRLDLLFPTEAGHPFHAERVDQVRIIGLPVGTTTLHSLSLVTAEDAYLKVGGVRSTLADGTVTSGGTTLSQDGQYAICHWGQDPAVTPSADRDGDGFIDHRKDAQNGRMAYASSSSAILSDESMGGAVGMVGASTIQNVFDELNRMEGVTATYDATALDAALTDSFGNAIGITGAYPTGTAAPVNRSSLWLTPNLPHVRLAAGTPVTLTARLVVDDVSVAAGRTAAQMRVYQRQRLGSVLEAQCITPAGARAAAGATMTARVTGNLAPSGGDAAFATGVTDASGFVTIPVRDGQLSGAEPLFHITG
jgi:hypothetical protein